MKCMVCELPTVFTYKISGIEAAFCPGHLPKQTPRINFILVARISC